MGPVVCVLLWAMVVWQDPLTTETLALRWCEEPGNQLKVVRILDYGLEDDRRTSEAVLAVLGWPEAVKPSVSLSGRDPFEPSPRSPIGAGGGP